MSADGAVGGADPQSVMAAAAADGDRVAIAVESALLTLAVVQ